MIRSRRAVKIYRFEELDDELALLPLCARRALDATGLKLSLESWQALPSATRRQLAALGSEPAVDIVATRRVAEGAEPAPTPIDPLPEPDPLRVPPEVSQVLGGLPLPDGSWSALHPLERYVLFKLASRGKVERLVGAYHEIVGFSGTSPHVAPEGGVRMVDVAQKQPSLRSAAAESRITMNDEAARRLHDAPKGDVLATARVAAIMAVKRTADLVPLCHPLHLTRIAVQLEPRSETRSVAITVTVEAFDRTGVEMEALTGASIAALTIYDMLKAFDRTMEIGPTRLVAKTGGRSGDYRR